jgi:protein-S-isoprenylcysteine O-methyltransferase Ste14
MVLFLKNLTFTLLVPGTVAVLVPYRIASRASGPALEPLHLVLAIPAFVVGGLIYFRCLWDFAAVGRGTPAPIDPPKALVVRGLYRYVRNPMYVGVLLVVVGWAAASWSRSVLAYGVALALLFHCFVLLVEEPMLRRQFGSGYDACCRSVGRWLPRAARAPGA